MSNNSIIEHRANYHFVGLREEYLLICQQCKYKKSGTAKSKNKASIHCKALILDILEHWTNTKRDKGVSFAVFMTYEQWSDAMYGMFGRNVIIDSLDELLGEGLIARESSEYTLNTEILDNLLKQLPPSQIKYDETPENLIPLSEYKCTGSQHEKVASNNARARDAGLPATLTTKEWTKTLDHFNWKCAICLVGNYQVLEHFIPLALGGGTTVDNCIPACVSCNTIKADRHPTTLSDDLIPNIMEIQHYLETQRISVVEVAE